MTFTATIEQTRSAQPAGSYVPTEIDALKAAADFRLIAVCPFVIVWRDGSEERVTERRLAKLQAAHSWQTDF